jgi:hypothetical protein
MFKRANHLTNNLIGTVLLSALMFILVWSIDRGNPQPGGQVVLWFLAMLGGAALVGWIVLAFRTIGRSGRVDSV